MRTSSFLADERLCRRPRLRLAPVADVQRQRLLRRHPHRGQHRGDPPAAGKQRPRLPASRRRLPRRRCRCDGAAAATPARCRSARSPARARASAATSATSRRASTPTISASCAAPTRRTSRTGSSGATSRRASTCARATSTSTSTPAGTSAATALYSGGNINSHWTFTNYYSIGGGFNLDAAPFRDRVTRGGPGVLGNPGKNLWYYANTDNRKALSFYYNGGHWADTKNSVAPRHHARASTGARPRRCRSTSACATSSTTTTRSGSSNEDLDDGSQRYVFGRIDQKTMSFTTRFNYTMTPTLSLQVYAEPFVSRRRVLELQGAGRRPRREVRGSLPAVRLQRQRRLQHPLVPHHQRAALGIPPGLAAVPGLAAGQAGRPGLRRFPLRPRLRRRVHRAVAQRLPDQVQLLAEYVGQQASRLAGQQASRQLPG